MHTVSANTPDHGREVNDDMWLRLCVETNDRVTIAQVILFGTRDSDMLATPLLQLLHDE